LDERGDATIQGRSNLAYSALASKNDEGATFRLNACINVWLNSESNGLCCGTAFDGVARHAKETRLKKHLFPRRMTSKIPGCFRLTSQSGLKPSRGGRKPRFKKSRAFKYCRLAGTASKRVIRIAVKRVHGG